MSQNLAELRPYQSFANVGEFKLAYRAFLYRHKSKLSESTLAVVQYIKRHSLNVPGVSFAGVKAISKTIGISERTVQRALATLENEYGVIERIGRKQKSNIIVFRAVEDASILPVVSPTDVTHECHPPQSDEPNTGAASAAENDAYNRSFRGCSLRGKKNIRLNNVDAHAPSAHISHVDLIPDYVPRDFASYLLARYDSQPEMILELWHKVREAGRKLKREIDWRSALKAYTEFAWRLGKGQIRGDAANYFFGVLVRMFGDENAKRAVTPTNDGADPADDTVHGNSVGEPQETSMKPAADAGNIDHYYEYRQENPLLNAGNEKYAGFYAAYGDETSHDIAKKRDEAFTADYLAHVDSPDPNVEIKARLHTSDGVNKVDLYDSIRRLLAGRVTLDEYRKHITTSAAAMRQEVGELVVVAESADQFREKYAGLVAEFLTRFTSDKLKVVVKSAGHV